MPKEHEDLLKSRLDINVLYDLYGGLLTDKQRKAFELHEMADCSLSEVADALKMSRQGAFELLQRAKRRLVEVEEIVGFKSTLSAFDKYKIDVERLLDQYDDKLPKEVKSEMLKLLSDLEETGDQDV